jgi:hypothetical protein
MILEKMIDLVFTGYVHTFYLVLKESTVALALRWTSRGWLDRRCVQGLPDEALAKSGSLNEQGLRACSSAG